MKQLAEKTNQAIIEYCLKFNIDPDVLIKQKAEIELLQIKIEKMKCCGNCKFQEIEDYTGCPICNISDCNFNSKWELKE